MSLASVCMLKSWYRFGNWHALSTLHWRHNDHDGVSNHQPLGCLLNRSFRRRSKKTSKLRVTGLCVRNSPETSEFPAQMASNAENVSIWWRHHEQSCRCASYMSEPKHWTLKRSFWILHPKQYKVRSLSYFVVIWYLSTLYIPKGLHKSGSFHPQLVNHIIAWCHQMETLSALLVLCAWNAPVTGEFSSQRSVTRSFMISLMCPCIYGWVNNREAGDLRRHLAQYVL